MSNEKPFIIVSDGFDKSLFADLRKMEALNVYEKSKLTLDELKALLPKAQALIVRSATKVTAELLTFAPNLKLVVRAGAGTDNIDKKACKEKGITVCNTPGANSNSAAEQAIALMFSVSRKTAWAHASMMKGVWDKSEGTELANKTIGIVGYGQIGQIVAKRLAGFEPKVMYFDTFVSDPKLPYVTRAASLEELFQKCDIVTLHCPLLPETKNSINTRLLEMMPKHAILINASRGGIVNENDLYEHLAAKKIRGAGVDVFGNEPLEADSKLRSLDNVVLTPHLGASTEEAQFRVGEMAVHIVREFFVNGKTLHSV
jgi:D-3-phosphoglycerate dehydrogenase